MNSPLAYGMIPPVNKEQLIKAHLPLVRFLVDRMICQVPSYMTRDEITSSAMMGLVDAANRFDPGKGVLFKTFAERRIRGAILDEARRMDWFSRTLREKQSHLADAIDRLEKKLGRPPEEEEIAAAMEMGVEDYRRLLGEVSHLGCISLQETLDGSEEGRTLIENLKDPKGKNPLEVLEESELARELAQRLDKLSEKERLVVALYYYEELSQKEIAEVMELSEGRVSQLHSQALAKLRVGLTRNKGGGARRI
jgi:RNA polymerase sigma factor for flagellar operon FliA